MASLTGKVHATLHATVTEYGKRNETYFWVFLAFDDLAVPRVLHVVLGLREDELAGRRLKVLDPAVLLQDALI